MSARITIEFDNDYYRHIICYNRKCKNKKLYYAYSYRHMRSLGWMFMVEDRDLIFSNYADLFIKDSEGNLLSAYCPKCSKELNKC